MPKRRARAPAASQASADPPEHVDERDVPMELTLRSPNADAWPRR